MTDNIEVIPHEAIERLTAVGNGSVNQVNWKDQAIFARRSDIRWALEEIKRLQNEIKNEELARQIEILRRASNIPIPDDDSDFTIEKARRGAESWQLLARNTVTAYDAAQSDNFFGEDLGGGDEFMVGPRGGMESRTSPVDPRPDPLEALRETAKPFVPVKGQSFASQQEWINRASRVLTAHAEYNNTEHGDTTGWRGPHFTALCFDQAGNRMRNGGDFKRATDEGTYPVWWVWPDQIPELLAERNRTTKGEDRNG